MICTSQAEAVHGHDGAMVLWVMGGVQEECKGVEWGFEAEIAEIHGLQLGRWVRFSQSWVIGLSREHLAKTTLDNVTDRHRMWLCHSINPALVHSQSVFRLLCSVMLLMCY